MINNNPQYFFNTNNQQNKKTSIPTTNNESLDWLNEENIDDEDNFEIKSPKSNKTKNILLGSLIALAAISVPTIEYLDKPKNIEIDYQLSPNKEKTEMICNPELIAKGGKNDSLVEIPEFLKLLNFSGMKNLPQSTQSAIEMIASAHYQPVMVSDAQAKEKLITQVEKIQKMVDNCIENSIKKPLKTHEQKLFEHNAKYISSVEIIDQVDFSEITKYQKDITVLKAILRNSVKPIKRDAFDCYEQEQKAINQAQISVNKIVEQYKKYAKIAGNTDYNNNLSTTELIDLLDKRSLDGIDKKTKKEIINKATTNYKPIIFDKIQDKKEIKEKNKQICEEVQKAQDILDFEALNYKLNHLPQ